MTNSFNNKETSPTRNNSSDFDINKLANNYSNKTNSFEQTATLEMDIMNQELISSIKNSRENQIDHNNNRYPCCIVWTPLPLITWFLPFIGHMGICYTNGIIRDFAGPYFVSEDSMGFGRPTRYWKLNVDKVPQTQNKKETWDRSVKEASDEYKMRMHNLFCDNCHSHVAYALNLMKYDNSSSWNMVKLCFLMLFKGSFVNFGGFLKTWLPFLIILGTTLIIGISF
ncbi:unnamed protein product [Brachionus calyciflorus]|uniref:Transmembrane protein 222 n=1 Tax=Brachionus calyciflorus TaxID=104777 RepID=A0A813P238_9BILA|nr:unnamed protein product [Brachionus calyciflorus]